MMRKFLLSLIILAVAISSPEARTLHGTSGAPPGPCTHSGAGYADGCSTAPAGGQFQSVGFFTTAKQSGQGNYYSAPGVVSSHPPPWDVACVDYACGATLPDASLTPAAVAFPVIFTGHPNGCYLSWDSNQVQCDGTANYVFDKINFDGIGLRQNGSGNITITNSHLTMTETNCRNYNGLGIVVAGSGVLDVESNTIDFDSTCSVEGSAYKSAGDPGLATLSSFTGSITSNTLTVGGSATGHIRTGSYVDWSGRSTGTQITAFVGPAPVTISSITISGNIATVTTSTAHNLGIGAGILMSGQSPIGYKGNVEVLSVPTSTSFTYQIVPTNVTPGGSATTVGSYSIQYMSGAAANGSQWTVSGTANQTSIAMTTGPVTTTINGAVVAHGGLTSSPATYKYNATIGYATMAGDTSGSTVTALYNYMEFNCFGGGHNNYVAYFPSPGVQVLNINLIQNFNTIVWNASCPNNTGTSTLSTFATSPSANQSGGYQIGYALSQNNNNTIVANKSYQGGNVVASAIRFLNQGSAVATVNGSVAAGVATITSVVTGGPLAVGQNIFCQTCSTPLKITSFGTGTGGTGTYNLSNTTDTVAVLSNGQGGAAPVYLYSGTIDVWEHKQNYFDNTGSGLYGTDYGNVLVTTTNTGGNIDMLTGAAAN